MFAVTGVERAYGVNLRVGRSTAIRVLIESTLPISCGSTLKAYSDHPSVARVNATLRRARGTAAQARPADVLRCRDLELDLDACTLTCAGAPVELTPVELRIMTLLMEHPGRVFTKQQLYEAGWEEDYVAAENSVMVCLSKLRAKLGDDPQAYIRTIRGIGYRLEK